MKTPLVVYIDVDDTLVRSVGSKRIPMTQVIEHVRQLYKAGMTLYCWSSAGADYAKNSAQELGLADCFSSFLSKPNVLIDDQVVADWRLCIEVHPLSVQNKTPETYWQEIQARS